MKLVLADDRVILREGLRRLFDDIEGFDIVGEVGSGPELMEVLDSLSPEMVILDTDLAGADAHGLIKIIKAHYPATRVLVLTRHGSAEEAHDFVNAGADGCIDKKARFKDLLRAVYTADRFVTSVTVVRPETAAEHRVGATPSTHILAG